jgi:pathogenesis-related protein 1
MSLRLLARVPLVLSLAACELPEPAGPSPTQAGLASKPGIKPGVEPSKPSLKPGIKPKVLPPSIKKDPPKDEPSEPPKDQPSEPPKDQPSGEETGPLVGLRAAHDQARTAVGVGALTWSTEIAAHAQAWANQLAANNCQLAHRPNNKYGENLYWSSHSATAAQVVATWVGESTHYDPATHTCAPGQICGHYTQVVWSKSTRLGCGRATCGTAEVWVCDYDPRGNYNGQAPF